MQLHMSSTSAIRCARAEGNFLFVDTVRFWSMAAVVANHCLLFAWLGAEMGRPLLLVLTLLKFGTVGFFIISGFLLGSRMRTDAPLAYLMRRMKRVVLPWSFWFALMVGLSVWLSQRLGGKAASFGLTFVEVRIIAWQALNTLLASSFWFVPNLLLGICVLLMFRKVLYRRALGGCLLVVNLFYSVNLYKGWVQSRHTEAFFGFIFFLWLGSYASHHYARLRAWLEQVRWKTLIAFATLGFGLSLGEGRLLARLGSADPVNTLRVSNMAMSICLLLVMAKAERRIWPKCIDVRASTFGIYLIHWMILVVCWRTGVRLLAMTGAGSGRIGLGTRVVFGLALFVLTYGISLGLTQFLSATSMAWMVGAKRVGKSLGVVGNGALLDVAEG